MVVSQRLEGFVRSNRNTLSLPWSVGICMLAGPRRRHSAFFGSPILITSPPWAVYYERVIWVEANRSKMASSVNGGEQEDNKCREIS